MTNKFIFSQRSEGNLKGIHPDLIKVARRALELSVVDFGVIEGFRTMERQRQLLREGSSQTLKSRHLTGHAIDVAAFIGKGVSWEWRYYEQISTAFKKASSELKIPIEWGGDWKTLKDGPHFQLPFEAYP
ncbi:MAG: M15 family metallopeptidase [Serratia sp. (in: enterobacteria)]|uniref:M15 family metallopeptidase n=1 Tax=Serratia sp. (in: enterobacteria) TaxID=616 RepID=UPI003F400B1E